MFVSLPSPLYKVHIIQVGFMYQIFPKDFLWWSSYPTNMRLRHISGFSSWRSENSSKHDNVFSFSTIGSHIPPAPPCYHLILDIYLAATTAFVICFFFIKVFRIQVSICITVFNLPGSCLVMNSAYQTYRPKIFDFHCIKRSIKLLSSMK